MKIIAVCFFVVLAGCSGSMEPHEINRQIMMCVRTEWFPIRVMNSYGEIVGIKCVPNDRIADVLREEGVCR